MNRRWIGIAASVALVLLGTFVLVRFVQGAEERALEGQETVQVLVVNTAVPKGSPAEDLGDKVETALVPAKVQAPGSVADLTLLQGTYTSVDLVPGEQVLSTRFVTAQELVALEEFALPEGLLEVTFSLAPDRALGGALRPGDEVAFVASFQPFNITEDEADAAGVQVQEANLGPTAETTAAEATAQLQKRTPASSHLIVHKVLVTNVQVERLPTEANEATAEEQGVDLAPTGNLLVTLAAPPEEVERMVFTGEFGLIWLAQESETAPENTTQIQTRETIYDEPGNPDL